MTVVGEQLVRPTAETSREPFISLDAAGVITAWNLAAKNVFGWSRAEVCGKLLAEVLIPQALREAYRVTVLPKIIGCAPRFPGTTIQVQASRRDGRPLAIELTLWRVNEGGRTMFDATLRDLTVTQPEATALDLSEERLQLLVDATREYGLFTLEPDGQISTWNIGAQRIQGYTDAEAVGQDFSMFYTEDARADGHPHRDLEVARTQGRFEEDTWRVRKDGSLFWASVVITAMFAEDGTLRGYSLVTRDTSERQIADQALRASEERLKLLVDATVDYGLFMLDPDGFIATWNVGAQRIKGYTEAEAVGKHFSIFYTEDARTQGHPQHVLSVARAQGRFEEESWRVRKDGSLFWASVVVTALTADDGTLRGFSKLTRDLSERHLAHQNLRDSEERFRGAFDDAPIGVSLVDLEGRFMQVNPALAKITGYPIQTLLGMCFQDLTHPEEIDADSAALGALVRGDLDSFARDKRYVQVDGTLVWVNVHVVPVRDSDGRVTALLSHTQDITQRRHHEAQLVELANHDALTGLANRTRFHETLDSHLDRCRRYGATGAVLMLDLDHFKRVNDSLGHNAGDELIISLAGVLQTRLRAADTVARLGGDEFAVLLPEASHADAEEVASALVKTVREAVTALDGARPRTITVSIGVTLIDDASRTSHELISAADLAMFDAKEAGRDRYVFYSDEAHTVPRTKARITWAKRIETALETDAFELWAQPVLDMRTNETNTHELLLRMRTPEGEILPPGTFLYIAERLGLITEIDHWVVGRSIDLLAKLQVHRPSQRLEVNMSGLSVGNEALSDHIARDIAASGVDPAGLVFEITETAAVERIHGAREFAEHLRELGCRFALDDFGAGFGSFYYLKHLPFDYVKIDGEFIANCTSNLTDRLVIESVVSICQGLGKETVAEFVGDQATLDFLRSRHVDYAQGYHIGRPIPVTQAFPELNSPPRQRQPTDPARALPGIADTSTSTVAVAGSPAR